MTRPTIRRRLGPDGPWSLIERVLRDPSASPGLIADAAACERSWVAADARARYAAARRVWGARA